MRRTDFHYELPQELIAQMPLPQRRASRLLVLDGATGAVADRVFADLPDLLRAGDLLAARRSQQDGHRGRAQHRRGVAAQEVVGDPIAAECTEHDHAGPNLAREIMGGQAAAAVVATDDLQVAKALQGLVQTGAFRVYVNHDVVGCEVGGALKNVIALGAGMAQGLGTGDNTRAMVITRGLAELTRLGVAMGAEPDTLSGLAGMGDLLATCISPHSRNRHVGEELGRGRALQEIIDEMNMVAEGVKTVASVLELGDRFDVELPICRTIHSIVHGGAKPELAYAALVERAPGHERESD